MTRSAPATQAASCRERRWLARLWSGTASAESTVAARRERLRPALARLPGVGIERRDLHAGARQRRRDARPHGAETDDGHVLMLTLRLHAAQPFDFL